MNFLSKILVCAIFINLFVGLSFGQTDSEARKLIKDTVSALQGNFADTVAKINKGEKPFKDGSLYVFIYDMALKMVAHPTATLVGKEFDGQGDVCGCLFRNEIRNRITKTVSVTNCTGKDKDAVEYIYKNPKTEKIEHKKAIFEKAKGSDGKDYIIVSGTYVGEGKCAK